MWSLGLCFILFGFLFCLSFAGAIVGVPMILVGILAMAFSG